MVDPLDEQVWYEGMRIERRALDEIYAACRITREIQILSKDRVKWRADGLMVEMSVDTKTAIDTTWIAVLAAAEKWSVDLEVIEGSESWSPHRNAWDSGYLLVISVRGA